MSAELVSWLSLVVYVLLITFVSVQVIRRRRPVGVTLSWLMLIFFLPVAGIICYQIFGERYLGSLRARRAANMEAKYRHAVSELNQAPFTYAHALSKRAEPLNQLTHRLLGLPIIGHNHLSNFSQAEPFFAQLCHDIEQAKHCILLEFYIVQPGGQVEQVLEALMAAAQRGVKVYLLADSVGSNDFFASKLPQRLREAKIEIVEALHANPLRMLLQRIDLRLHRKIIAIDHQVAYTGSMNLADPRFFKQDAKVGQWVDLMVRIEGPAAMNLQAVVAFDFEMETGKHLTEQLEFNWDGPSKGEQRVQILPSGPGIFGEHIIQLLLTAIYVAKRQIILTTPYFVPDDSLQIALVSAAQRGVDVRLIVPKRNDSVLVRYASHSFYQELLDAGVCIHRFEGGLLHTKSLLIDQEVALVGTVNLDMRSLWLNFEVTSIFDDQAYAAELHQLMLQYIKQSRQIDPIHWKKRPIHRRLLENVAHLLSPLL